MSRCFGSSSKLSAKEYIYKKRTNNNKQTKNRLWVDRKERLQGGGTDCAVLRALVSRYTYMIDERFVKLRWMFEKHG